MIGDSSAILTPPSLSDEMPLLLERISRGEHVPSFQTVRITKSGSPIDVWVTMSPIRDAAGHVVGASTIARDVTERLEVERALREAQDAYRLVFENANEGMFYTTMDSETVAVNPALAHLLGYDSPEALMADREHASELWSEAKREEMVRLLDSDGAVRDFEMEGLRRDGTKIWISIDLVVVKDDAGQPAGYQGMVLDISERKEAEEALRRASQEEARANRAKTEFLSRMSHELRTPLTAVLGFGQLLERRQLPPDHQAEAVGHILKAGRHLLGLIDEVLDIARIEEGRLSLSPEPVRIGDVMDEALTLIQPVAEQRGIAITAFGEHAACHVTADRQRLTQVFLNLLSNAVKYNRERGTVTLSCAQSDDQLTVRVRDEGNGIAPELQSRLFSPFDRLGAEQTGIEGTGLGLALSKRLVEAMGGMLSVDSALGEGSTFWVRLPLVKDPLDQLVTLGKPASAPPEGPDLVSTILYVEDNLSNLHLVEQVLQHWPGIRVVPAMQGRLGIDLTRQHHPDLVLLDVNLPDIGGKEVLTRIRSDPATAATPVVVLTADVSKGLKEHLLGAGATAFLTKPFDLDEFFEVLTDILGPTEA
jgi:PAS domain S-box-containing protein